jgi:predicted permease
VGAALADAIAGDLAEERARRVGRDGAVRAAAWHWMAMAGIGAHAAMTHLSRVVSAWTRGLRPRGGDVRHAVRSLRRAPWYAGTVIGVIALSMALATTVFAVVDGVLFKPLPYEDAAQLYSLEPGFSEPVMGRPSVSIEELRVWADAMPEVGFTGFRGNREAMIGAARVQSNFFDVLGIRPLVGGFRPEHFEQLPARPPVVISHRLWRQRFGADPNVLGREIAVDPRAGGSWEVVGVMPEGFVLPSFEDKAEVLLPLSGMAASRRFLEVVVRLPAGVSRQAAQVRLEAVMLAAAEGKDLAPGGNRFRGPFDRAVLHPLGERMASRSWTMLAATFSAVGVLILIACLNVSGLMAARSLDRAQELSLRRALGARPAHLARAVLVENAALVVPGALLGAALSPLLLQVALSVLPERLLLLKHPSIDWRVAGFVAVAAAACLLLSSFWPIRRAVRRRALVAGIAPTLTPSRSVLGRLSVAAQVALAVVLTVGGTLLVGSLGRVWQNETGLDPEGLALVELRVQRDGAAEFLGPAPGVAARLDRFLRDVRALPGVEAAGAIDGSVLDGTMVDGLAFHTPGGARGRHNGYPVTAGYFDAVALPVRVGRLPTDEELESGAPLLVASEVAAAAFWPDRSALGRTLLHHKFLPTGGIDPNQPPGVYTVVGVVADVRFDGLDQDVRAAIYGPYVALTFGSSPVVAIRSTQIDRVLPQVIQLAEAIGPSLSVVRAKPATDILADTIRQRRFLAWLFGAFAVAALTLVGVGILGVVAMSTARRTREIGIRMALGSTRDGVVRLLAAEQMTAVVLGLVVGGLVAAWAVRFVESYLYELTAFDPRVWAAAAGCVLLVAAIGALAPSLRASRVEPAVVLRNE